MNENALEYYLNQIENSTYSQMEIDLFNDCLEEGFPYEHTNGDDIKNWVFIKLNLSDNHKEKLANVDNDTVDFFNELDIRIKERYNLRVLDLINYTTGEVFIIKYTK